MAQHKIWGGRFDAPPHDLMVQINSSIDIDKRLYRQDIEGSIAHARMLAATGIITQEEGQALVDGLETVRQEIESGAFVFRIEFEDIHMNIEARLTELTGEVAGKLHTARSRNDQVATAFRLWVRDAIEALTTAIDDCVKTLEAKAQEYRDTIMPGFTHLQIAQPVALSLHLRAYAAMLARDKGRLLDCSIRLNECPLGACALAGTSWPIDRGMTAKALGFGKSMENTIDAVASRDFALEFLSACSICAVHLSRLAEELVLWSSAQFGYIALSSRFTTGSSIMPQKKNPDAAELVRAKSGCVAGSLMQLLMVMKALPLAYNKDMQEDKPPVFESFDALLLCLQAMTGMIADMKVNAARMRQDVENGYAMATALADWLALTFGIPFRQSHHISGRIVRLAEKQGVKLHELALADMQDIEPRITKEVYGSLRVCASPSG